MEFPFDNQQEINKYILQLYMLNPIDLKHLFLMLIHF